MDAISASSEEGSEVDCMKPTIDQETERGAFAPLANTTRSESDLLVLLDVPTCNGRTTHRTLRRLRLALNRDFGKVETAIEHGLCGLDT